MLIKLHRSAKCHFALHFFFINPQVSHEKYKKKQFIKTSIRTAIALGTPLSITNCKNKKSVQNPVQEINAKVAATHEEYLFEMTRDANEAFSNISFSILLRLNITA